MDRGFPVVLWPEVGHNLRGGGGRVFGLGDGAHHDDPAGTVGQHLGKIEDVDASDPWQFKNFRVV